METATLQGCPPPLLLGEGIELGGQGRGFLPEIQVGRGERQQFSLQEVSAPSSDPGWVQGVLM